MNTYYVIKAMYQEKIFSLYYLLKALVYDSIAVCLGLAWS